MTVRRLLPYRPQPWPRRLGRCATLALSLGALLASCAPKVDEDAGSDGAGGFDGAGDGTGDGAGDGTSDGGATDGGSDGTATTFWFTSCGDPVCSGYRGPTEGLEVCTDQVEEAPCSPEGAACDLENDCNVHFTCAAEDPKDQPGGCPRSLKSTKFAIQYLDPAGRRAAAEAALRVPLATWRYKGEPEVGPTHLGFLIDDLVQGGTAHPAVRPDGGHVDLYGYTSLTLAAVQEQAVGLAELRAELGALRAANAQLKSENSALEARLSKIEATLGPAPGAR